MKRKIEYTQFQARPVEKATLEKQGSKFQDEFTSTSMISRRKKQQKRKKPENF